MTIYSGRTTPPLPDPPLVTAAYVRDGAVAPRDR